MKSPIETIRRQHGLSRKEFAALCGVSYDAVYENESGLTRCPHKKILQTLAGLGYDPEMIQTQYAQFLSELRAKALAKAEESQNGP